MFKKDEILDDERMSIVFSCLIINVASINKKYVGLKEFMIEFNLGGQTNGKLLGVAEMVSPPYQLIEIVEEINRY